MRKTVLVATSCVFLVAQAFAAPPPKVSICHFDEEEAAWVSITISEQGAAAHMRNHDDALPGAATAVSGTALDADCAAGAVAPEELQAGQPAA
jgi:hypothetical protein